MISRVALSIAVFLLPVCLGVTGPVRFEVELRRLSNKDGKLANGHKCDLTSSCDHRITGYFDTVSKARMLSGVRFGNFAGALMDYGQRKRALERDDPIGVWPGGKPMDRWTLVFERDNENEPIVNKIVSRDVCSGDIQRANLRLNVVDVDDLTKNDLVEQFECIVPTDTAASSVNRATWSTERKCTAKNRPNEITLNYRFRVFGIADQDCGRAPAGASAGRS